MEKQNQKNNIDYLVSVSIIKSLLNAKLITEEEYKKIDLLNRSIFL